MADFRTDTSAIKVDPVKGVSLADMLNIQKSTYELNKLKELYPSIISEQQAKSKQAGISANVEEQTAEPKIQKAKSEALKSQLDTNTAHFNSIIKNGSDLLTKPNLTKEDIIQRYTEIHKNGPNADNPVALKQALMGLPEKGSATDYKKFIIANMGKTLDSQSQFEKMFPAVSLTDVGGKIVPVTTGNPYVAAIPPGVPTGEGIQKGIAPQTTSVNNVQGTIDAQGNFKPLGNQEGTSPPVNEKPQIITGETKIFNAGGVPQLNEQQKSNADIAREEKAKYGGMAVEIGELEKSISSAEKTLSSSAASAPGRAIRSGGKWLGGNEDLDILTKSLADITNRQAKIMGAGTDAARDASAAASPNVNLTEGGLRSILERTKATNTGFLSFLEANKNYETNRGSDNANVNHTQFKNAWGQNYDTNYFMVKNINRSNMSDSEKQLAKQKLFKNYSEEQLQEYKQKAINLKRLERGDYQ